LARHYDDPGLTFGTVLSWQRAMRSVFQAGQPRGGKPIPPLLHGVPCNPQFLSDVDVARSPSRSQHDPRALCRLLAARPRSHPSLQLAPFLQRQDDLRRPPTHRSTSPTA
jgi:hypothetical protein